MSIDVFNQNKSLTYARSITASTVAARQPTGFAGGGRQAKVYNSGSVAVAIQFYSFAVLGADPTLTFPADGAPPTGQPVVVIPAATEKIVTIPANADSFAAIGSAAGPSLIYVTRGDGL